MEGTDTPGGTNATYSILRKTDATSYTWSVPLGASIVSHPGGAGTPTDTSIVVHFDGTFTTGTITVASVNGCGASANRVLTLKRLVPPTPGAITGIIDVCPLMAVSYIYLTLPT